MNGPGAADRLLGRLPPWTGSLAVAVGAIAWAITAIAEWSEYASWRPWVPVVLLAASAVDLLIAWRGLRRPPGLLALCWLLARTLVSVWGLLWGTVLIALPAYVLAMLVWTVPRAGRASGSPAGPHAYDPAANAWRHPAASLGLMRTIAGAHTAASVRCGVCGAEPDDPRHGVPEPAPA